MFTVSDPTSCFVYPIYHCSENRSQTCWEECRLYYHVGHCLCVPRGRRVNVPNLLSGNRWARAASVTGNCCGWFCRGSGGESSYLSLGVRRVGASHCPSSPYRPGPRGGDWTDVYEEISAIHTKILNCPRSLLPPSYLQCHFPFLPAKLYLQLKNTLMTLRHSVPRQYCFFLTYFPVFHWRL